MGRALQGVHWEDIAALGECKRLLKEAVVMPLRYPQLFTGLLSGWKGQPSPSSKIETRADPLDCW